MKIINNATIIDSLGICYFDGTYDGKKKVGSIDISFSDYIESVMKPDKSYIKKVERLRQTKTKDVKLYKRLKWKMIHVYPSCQFDKKGCRYENITAVSGLLVYDLQGVDDMIITKLRSWSHTVSLHKSIGGDTGDYVLFLYCPGLTVDSYTGTWEKGNELIQTTFGLKPESSDTTKDVTRIRYLSYDDNCYYNPIADPILTSEITIARTFTKEQTKAIDKLLNNESEWFRFGLSLVATYGEKGRELFHIFSKVNATKYNEIECDKKYDRLLKDKRKKGITAGTLFYLLKEMSVPYQLPKSTRIVVNGEQEEITTQMIIDFLNSQYCRNEINDKIIDLRTGKEVNVETVWVEYALQLNDNKFRLQTIHSLLRGERMNTINPVKNFFDKARERYNGGSYIAKFIKTLPVMNKKTPILFIIYWLIQCYRQAVFNETNRTFLIFSGPEEIGKSRALEWFCPLYGYLKTGPLNTDSKDTRIALANSMIWIDDELKVFRAFDINKIKALISTTSINERLPYARSTETLKRICSFCGSTNAMEMLPETEGNTRFLVVELVDKINWKEYEKIDKELFWGEVIHLSEKDWVYNNIMRLHKTRKITNQEVTINTVIGDAIRKELRSTVKDKRRKVMTLLEVCECIDPEGRLHAIQNQNLVRDIISRLFGHGRWYGYTDKGPRLGYPCNKSDISDSK